MADIIDLDAEDFKEQVTFIDNSLQSVNLFDQIPSYNDVDTDIFISNISKELDQQKTLNNLLQSNEETVLSRVDRIKAFTATNTSKVEDQLSQLRTIASELKEVVSQNTVLKEKYTEINELATDDKYVSLAKSIQDIKKQKQDILDFLKNANLIAPPLNI
jgi:hypothetical protein